MDSIRDAVRSRYARTAIQMQETGSCCDSACWGGTHAISGRIHEADYVTSELAEVGLTTGASLGCGNPTALAQLHPGEIVLDLGSGAGLDVLLSARRVAPDGHAYGLDMTDEMLAVARANQAKAGVAQAAFLQGTIQQNPLPDRAGDGGISNCGIHLAPGKRGGRP